jgi:hypothetical protein
MGFWNIALAVTDYYQYYKITNIERVTPKSVTFPAITVCANSLYERNYYIKRTLIRKDTVEIHSSNISRITNFLNFPSTRFVSFELSSNKSSTVTDHLDAFFFSDLNTYDCFRFNAATNKSMELFRANKSDDYFFVNISRDYKEYINISRDEYYQYTFYYSRLYVYITDNFLNSFDKVEPLILDTNYRHDIEIEKQSIEIKLPGPYNECKELLVDEHFHQSNCMSNCIYREIYKNYNCSFPLV